jgi:hypothetical protein
MLVELVDVNLPAALGSGMRSPWSRLPLAVLPEQEQLPDEPTPSTPPAVDVVVCSPAAPLFRRGTYSLF